eukprot:324422-Pleurochrysis_carterae.AAC.2
MATPAGTEATVERGVVDGGAGRRGQFVSRRGGGLHLVHLPSCSGGPRAHQLQTVTSGAQAQRAPGGVGGGRRWPRATAPYTKSFRERDDCHPTHIRGRPVRGRF